MLSDEELLERIEFLQEQVKYQEFLEKSSLKLLNLFHKP
jgi:hypothetical protein